MAPNARLGTGPACLLVQPVYSVTRNSFENSTSRVTLYLILKTS
jgi:hypothetical protein